MCSWYKVPGIGSHNLAAGFRTFLERSAEQGIFAGCGIEIYAAAILMEIICDDADCKSADDDLQCGMVSWRVQAQALFLVGSVSLTPLPISAGFLSNHAC